MSVLAPLLRPASWRLLPGAADVPWLRHSGVALLLLSALALLAWTFAVGLDAWRMRSLSWPAVLSVPLCCFGLWHVWRLGRRWWGAGAALTLRWSGPLQALESGESTGGWRVDAWGEQSVGVKLVWDWQRVMLLRLQSLDDARAQVWVWLRDDPRQRDREVHRLRTLLCLPASMTCPPNKLPARAGLMASSRHEAPSATATRVSAPRSSSRNRPAVRAGQGERVARAVRVPAAKAGGEPLRFEDDFPATQILDRFMGDEAQADPSLRRRA